MKPTEISAAIRAAAIRGDTDPLVALDRCVAEHLRALDANDRHPCETTASAVDSTESALRVIVGYPPSLLRTKDRRFVAGLASRLSETGGEPAEPWKQRVLDEVSRPEGRWARFKRWWRRRVL